MYTVIIYIYMYVPGFAPRFPRASCGEGGRGRCLLGVELQMVCFCFLVIMSLNMCLNAKKNILCLNAKTCRPRGPPNTIQIHITV